MTEKFKAAIERILENDLAFAKAAKYSKYQKHKISSVKRSNKWRQIYVKALKEYHAWIGKELRRLK